MFFLHPLAVLVQTSADTSNKLVQQTDPGRRFPFCSQFYSSLHDSANSVSLIYKLAQVLSSTLAEQIYTEGIELALVINKENVFQVQDTLDHTV